jgi:hypothetical protein
MLFSKPVFSDRLSFSALPGFKKPSHKYIAMYNGIGSLALPLKP